MTQAETQNLQWIEELNPEQRAAVTHGTGPLLIVAGAGSGKTRTLAYRVAWLIANGTDPERILLLTFTRRASEEMIKRASAIVQRGASSATRVWGGTFHAIANRLLRTHARSAGLNTDFTVMDEADAETLIDVIRHDLKLHSKEKRFPRKGTCLDIYSRCVNGQESLEEILKLHFPWCEQWGAELKRLFSAYAARKQEKNVFDYDDLLLYWKHMLDNTDLASRIGGKFDHILVDEYQDTNSVQSAILRGMRKENTNITVVGDDAQSIYSFRAATIRNMLDFPKHFPNTTVLTLSRNYRSVTPILNTTNLLIAQATDRFSKNLWSDRTSGSKPKLVTCRDEAAQNEYVISQVLAHYEEGVPLKSQAVLFRAAHLSDSLEAELVRRGIPYHKYGGLRFLEAAHVKDLISILRILENPRDELAWFRVLQKFDGVGPSTAQRAAAHVMANAHDPRSIRSFDAPPAAQKQFSSFADLLDQLYIPDTSIPPAAQVERVRTFYDPIMRKIYENPSVRAHDLENLEQIASTYRSRQAFLTDLLLDPPTSTGDLAGPPVRDEDWLVLSTIHSSKGCEWDAVFLIHASDGCLPSDMATGSRQEIEEELRLTYVAMTRARDFLYVTWPLRYYHKWYKYTDKHSYAQISRFLTPGVVSSMERVTHEPAKGVDEDISDETPSRSIAEDIRSKIRAQWDG